MVIPTAARLRKAGASPRWVAMFASGRVHACPSDASPQFKSALEEPLAMLP
jgi:hypothetical protein